MRILFLVFVCDVIASIGYGREIIGQEEIDGETFYVGPIPKSNMFSGAPMSPGDIKVLDASQAPEIYTVEHGDTLIDICEQLLGRPGYWPRLWSLNPYIKNPHFVWPGMRLRFFPGGDDLPPFLEVLENDDIVVITDEMEDNQLLKIDIPDWTPYEPGDSEVVSLDGIEPFDKERIDFTGPVIGDVSEMTTQPLFLSPQEITPYGEIVSVGEGAHRFGRRAIVDITGEDLTLNKAYTVVRKMKRTEDGYDSLRSYVYRFIAHIQISELNSGQARGVITSSFLKVQQNDSIIAFRDMNVQVPRFIDQPSSKPLTSGILSAFGAKNQKLGQSHQFTVVNVGQQDGIDTGQILDVHRLESGYLTPVGQIYTVQVTQEGAVAVVRPGAVELLQGDLIVGNQVAINQ